MHLKPQTLLVGACVTHPERKEDEECPSIAGVVASHAAFGSFGPASGNFLYYKASARLQPNNTEVIFFD